MGSRDKRVDVYIAKAAPFAQPVLLHIRDLVHKGCPDVEEHIKWGCPHFVYKGILCSMAAFKAHCTMGFWKSSLIPGAEGILEKPGETSAMGQLGRITGLKDLPPDRIIVRLVRSAAALNDAGITLSPRTAASERKAARVPLYLKTALKNQPAASRAFDAFTPSQKREYVEWLAEAKTAETRRRRLGTAVSWMKEGKSRNWKYMRKAKRS